MSFEIDGKRIEEGQRLRITGGPYYPIKDEEGNTRRVGFGLRGIYAFIRTERDGILVSNVGGFGTLFCYTGETHTSKATGTVMQAHKITIPKSKRRRNKND